MANQQQTEQMKHGAGFVAALDQSGGSTPKALGLYGITADAWANDAEMYAHIHAMRSRIARSPAFTGENIIGAILFEMTMDRDIEGMPAATYLWEKRGVVPFLKVDKGLEADVDGVQLMKPMPDLEALLTRAGDAGVFGTKMRSVINAANANGIRKNVGQQFDIAEQILSRDLMPIVEPEVNIASQDKPEIEALLLGALTERLDALPEGQQVMLKLTLPETPNHYAALANHPAVMRIVALSGGYDRAEANRRLAQNAGMIASFSRALTEGLSAGQTDAAFDDTLGQAITEIRAASIAG